MGKWSNIMSSETHKSKAKLHIYVALTPKTFALIASAKQNTKNFMIGNDISCGDVSDVIKRLSVGLSCTPVYYETARIFFPSTSTILEQTMLSSE